MRIIDNDGAGGAGSMGLTNGVHSEQPQSKAPQTASRTQPPETDLDQLWQWNKDVPALLQTCIHDIITEQCQSQPEAVAIQSWDGTLTYAELDRLSSKLAHHLISRGVTIGTRLPLCFEKSMWAVVSVLGVMKAGATFSLTDPSQPEARLRTIVEQTEAELVITSVAQSDLGQRIAGNGQVLAVSRNFFDSTQEFPAVELPKVPSSTPMYIIFTSGSTGKPKGVVISHENYTSGALPRAEAVGYKSTSRVFDFPSYAFDVSIDCMLCTLAMGGRVCVPSEEQRMNDLSGAIRDSQANMVHMTPSVARVLDADIIPSLEVLGLGGEAIGASDAANWSQHTNLVIAYGPSECTVGCTINNRVTVSTGIGKGVGGVTWIVDPEDHDRLMGVGEVGELFIEGPVVGVGYLGEPIKTAEVFIHSPTWLTSGHSSIPGRQGRLYKTGDLVRYESNGSGSIEFVGRKDQQVKLRGQRVELAEVEHHLQACLAPGVKVAAEVLKPENGAPTLVAFLSEPNLSTPPEATDLIIDPSPELASALASIDSTMGVRVPRYMIPAAFITLRDMPTLVSRKIDRKSLRAIGASIPREKLSKLPSVDEAKDEPSTEEEKQLSKAWFRVLGPETQIYRQSSFFQLGGDSLRAMKLIAAAREEGLTLTVADVFTYPVLSDMVGKAKTSTAASQEDVAPFSLLDSDWKQEQACQDVAALCGIETDAVEDIYPCTPLQEALMALSAKVKEAYVAQRVVGLDSREQGERLIRAFDVAQKDCPILRTRIVQVPGKGLVQVVVRGGLQWHDGSSLDEYLIADRDQAMELGTPLVRYALIQDEASGKTSFVLTMHHALYDGWAMPLVVDRVNKAYQGDTISRPADFKHFIKYLMGHDRSESAKFWTDRLDGGNGPQFPALPYAGYQTQADSLLELYVPLEQQSTSNVTVATIIRAAWALVASQYINTDDIIFGETLTGRNAPIVGAEEIEGPMITTVPVRVQIDREAAVTDYLQQIQEQNVAQIPHEHFGLQHIRRLSPDALEACELRTGLVLHPSTAEEPLSVDLPANRLVPAGDAEAAQEALKFNTYALMLVCSIDPKGFLIMASFDSKTVEKPVMEQVLEQLKQTAQKLCGEATASVEQAASPASLDIAKAAALASGQLPEKLTQEFPGSSVAYVVDPRDANRLRPIGAVGEVIVGAEHSLDREELPKPDWAEAVGESSGTPCHFFRTNKFAKWSPEGMLVLVENASTKSDAITSKDHASSKKVSASSRRQKKMRSFWARVLRIEEDSISLNDSFFNLGGDSISAMKLVSEARAEGVTLTVMQIFQARSLYDMAKAMKEEGAPKTVADEVGTFELLGKVDSEALIQDVVQPQLADIGWKVVNALPVRPLQEVAIRGTISIPRFSARYELMYFDKGVDKQRLTRSCEELVKRNEILRTVFIEHQGQNLGVVLEELRPEFIEYETDGDVEDFSKKLCHLDVLTKMPLGSSFVKWFLVQGEGGQSCLIFRISHAQYDEICLPIILRQLSAFYEGKEVQDMVPFSSYVGHLLRRSIPESIPYWRDLLQGSQMTVLKPEAPPERKNHFAIEKTLDISMRPRETTAATLPTAAWALTLAKRLSLRDVTFGEVVSGRNIDFPNADAVVGPCWQYIPVRVKFDTAWTVLDLLNYVQHQHVASSAHECMGIREIAENCTDWPSDVDWFDTVVHQDVEHVESLGLSTTGSRMETLYAHEEPLREWKLQAFFSGDKMTLEIVTIESWADYARELLDEVVDVARFLVEKPRSRVLE